MEEIKAVLSGGVIAAIALTVLAVVALVRAEAKWRIGESRMAVWMTKPLASAGFVLTAILAGALNHTFGQLILVGLLLGAIGDVLLIPDGQNAGFKLGMASFLGGHVIYVYAFFVNGLFTAWSGMTILLMTCLGAVCLRIFWPHVRGLLRPLLITYVIVISLMAISATGMTVARGSALYLTAAGLFVVSDILVAWDRFIRHRPINGAVALPMYYLAQLMFALATGANAGY